MILHMDHKQWRDFYVRLNDRLIKAGSCKKHTLKYTRQILTTIKDVNVEETIEYFMKSNGNCDCSVLYNVFRSEPRPEKYYFNEKHKKKNKKRSREEYIDAMKWKKKWKGSIRRYNWY